MKNTNAKQALKSFLNLFSASTEIKNITNEHVYYGICTWADDEDSQDIRWINIYNDESEY